MKTRLHRITATTIVAVLMAGVLPVSLSASRPDGFCTVFPWWPTCQRTVR